MSSAAVVIGALWVKGKTVCLKLGVPSYTCYAILLRFLKSGFIAEKQQVLFSLKNNEKKYL